MDLLVAYRWPFVGEQDLSRITAFIRIAAGAFAALVLSEVVLRMLVTPGNPPLPQVERDSFQAPPVAHRQIDEGIATAHFSTTGARLTGNPPIDSGRMAVILGDSYVVAEQVPDRETMGAELERVARSRGVALSARQYGWLGASPAQYLYAAPQVRRRWPGAHVFIVLSDNDFDHGALVMARPRIRIDATGSARIVGAPMSASPEQSRSAVAMLVRHRWLLIQTRLSRYQALQTHAGSVQQASADVETYPDSAEFAAAPRAIVNALAEAYGDALTLIYVASVRVTGDSATSVIERRFLDGCAQRHVDCESSRARMVAARAAGKVSHGAPTATLGNGHLNETGHAIVGRMMWEHLRPHVANTRHPG